MKTIYNILLAGTFLLTATFSKAQDNPVISMIKQEVDRNKSELKIDKLQPPFFISYVIADNHYLNISSTLGALQTSRENRSRRGIPELLVGDYMNNNANFVNMTAIYGSQNSHSNIPLHNNPEAIATPIWSSLDNLYKSATEQYESKQATIRQQKMTEEELSLPDFEKTEPVTLILPPVETKFDKAYWENFTRKASETAKKYPQLTNSFVHFSSRNSTYYYYNTEGTQYAIPETFYQLKFTLSARTKDGQELYDEMNVEYPTFEEMPDLKTYMEMCESAASFFMELYNAPIIDESYSGPVMFEKVALGEMAQAKFFTGNRLIAKRKPIADKEASRRFSGNNQLKGNDLETMKDKKVISRSLSIKSLSGSEYYDGFKLSGYYPLDAEGVTPDKELFLIENGVLRNMINGRRPTLRNPKSNGHARYDSSLNKKIAPGNLLLSSNDTYSNEELKKKLIAAAKEEDLEYAYIVRKMRGDIVMAIYKVYVEDGREELVRGADFIDFNIKSFKRVLGASNRNFAYNKSYYGFLTTYIVPEALIFEELEIRRDNITFKSPYIVPKPEIVKNK